MMESLAISLVHAVPALSGVPLWTLTLLLMVVVAAVVLTFALLYAGLATYVERKVAGDIQARIGPNRVGPVGLPQFLAGGFNLSSKGASSPPRPDPSPSPSRPTPASS